MVDFFQFPAPQNGVSAPFIHHKLSASIQLSHSDIEALKDRKGRENDCSVLGEVANYVGLATTNLERMRLTGEGPVFAKLGRSVRYRRADVDNWISSRIVRSTSEVKA
jgi:predicted DNA-binding transcriptional regulator AlpA